jgi:broad specificity phosphatase PhoE
MTSTTHDPNSSHALLTIVRHGQTSANVDGVWHGSTNTALTDHGRRQAAAVGAHIEANYQPIPHVYASPLDRAHQTAQAIATPLGLTPILDDELVEFDLGDWEGMAFKELTEEKKIFQNMSADPHFAPHGGESPKQVGDRLAGALTRLAAAHPGERIVVVSHGAALTIALGLLLDDHYAEWNRMMKNCAISELAFAPKAELLSFNQREHLPSENTA